MIFRRRIFFYSIVPLLVFCEYPTPTFSNMNDDLLGSVCKMTYLLIHKCWSQEWHSHHENGGNLLALGACLKRRSLLALDRIVKEDRIKITDGIELVKYRSDNFTKRQFKKLNTVTDISKADPPGQITQDILDIFNTHILEIHLNNTRSAVEGRRRHHRHMSVIVFGVLAMTMIAIPLGFQFLAVLGGKALLLAKMALILTSIQGLKRIATSNLGYGLYQAPHNSNPWHYDRRLYYDTKDDPQGYQGYNTPDAAADLLHPLSPRILTARDFNQ